MLATWSGSWSYLGDIQFWRFLGYLGGIHKLVHGAPQCITLQVHTSRGKDPRSCRLCRPTTWNIRRQRYIHHYDIRCMGCREHQDYIRTMQCVHELRSEPQLRSAFVDRLSCMSHPHNFRRQDSHYCCDIELKENEMLILFNESSFTSLLLEKPP